MTQMPQAEPLLSPRDRLRRLLDDPDVVTDEQRAAVLEEANLLLFACPGSGKTRTMGLRAAWHAVSSPARATAATTYTNVAVGELAAAAAWAGASFREPHYVGTLHGFLLRYVLYPFVQLYDTIDARIKVVTDTGDWPADAGDIRYRGQSVGLKPWHFHFRANGELVLGGTPETFTLSDEQALHDGRDRALDMKENLLRRGFVSASDAMWLALGILEDRQDIARAVATRFDELIVDEVQDTSDVQLRCVQLLAETGQLRSLVLIGDLGQAIYGWQGADPQAAVELAQALELSELRLTRNFRSSQAICDVSYRLSERETADCAAGPNAEFGVAPEVFVYDSADLRSALTGFDRRLNELGIPSANSVILTRTRALAARINGVPSLSVSPTVALLGRVAAAQQSRVTFNREHVQGLDRLFVYLRNGHGSLAALDEVERREIRRATAALLQRLPPLDHDMRTWTAAARDAVKAVVDELGWDLAVEPGSRVRARAGYSDADAANAFHWTTQAPRAGTVHSAKGESHDAVLLIGARPASGRNDVRGWAEALAGGPVDEEARIAYVALTRARMYCAVAVPRQAAEFVDAFIEAGFGSTGETLSR
jgi:superfamily I DNA/RNA helicase